MASMRNPFSPRTHFNTILDDKQKDVQELTREIYVHLYENSRTVYLAKAIDDFRVSKAVDGKKPSLETLVAVVGYERETIFRWLAGKQLPAAAKYDEILYRLGKRPISHRPTSHALCREILRNIIAPTFTPRLTIGDIADVVRLGEVCSLGREALYSYSSYKAWELEHYSVVKTLLPGHSDSHRVRLLQAAACWQYAKAIIPYPLNNGQLTIDDHAIPAASSDEISRGPKAAAPEYVKLSNVKRKSYALRLEDLHIAADALLLGIGDQVSGNNCLAPAESRRVGMEAGHIRNIENARKELYVWSCYNPQSVWFAKRPDNAHLLSAVLPLTEKGYERFRSGEIDYIQVASGVGPARSQYLLLSALFGDSRSNNSRAAQSQLRSMMHCQVAILGTPINNKPGLTFLSFCATPVNERRLLEWGFQRTDAKVPGTNYSIVELKLHSLRSCTPKTRIIYGLIWMYQKLPSIKRLQNEISRRTGSDT